MSQTLTAHVSLWAENGALVNLAPGDELPEWAEGKVGDHCLTLPTEAIAEPEVESENPEAENADPDDEGDAEDAPASEVKGAKPTEAPDFTAPAPRRGRPRK